MIDQKNKQLLIDIVEANDITSMEELQHFLRNIPELAVRLKPAEDVPTVFSSVRHANRYYVVDLATEFNPEVNVKGVFATFNNEEGGRLKENHRPEFLEFAFPNEAEARAFGLLYKDLPESEYHTVEYARPQPVYFREDNHPTIVYTLSDDGRDIRCLDVGDYLAEYPHGLLRAMYTGLLFNSYEAAEEYKLWLDFLNLPYSEVLRYIEVVFK